jgi:hypothetical protein
VGLGLPEIEPLSSNIEDEVDETMQQADFKQ